MEQKNCTAVILAAGSGSRMKSATPKQFMLLEGKPLVWYSLNAVEQSDIIEQCILVTGANDIPYVREEIVEKYGFRKVKDIVAGGSERWESVANAMDCITDGGYVFIHDGARPFLTEEIIADTYRAARQHRACVTAVPSKDTVKLADGQGFAETTPDRRRVWAVQTPQVFDADLIIEAYGKLRAEAARVGKENIQVTDDASVVEQFTDYKVKLVQGSYQNIKITTPEDLKMARVFLGE